MGEEMNAWGNFIKQASTAQMVKPEWSELSPAQIEYMRRQQEEADEHLNRLVAHLKKHGAMSTANIATDFKWKTDAVYRRCERGVERGVIRRSSSGIGRKVIWEAT